MAKPLHCCYPYQLLVIGGIENGMQYVQITYGVHIAKKWSQYFVTRAICLNIHHLALQNSLPPSCNVAVFHGPERVVAPSLLFPDKDGTAIVDTSTPLVKNGAVHRASIGWTGGKM